MVVYHIRYIMLLLSTTSMFQSFTNEKSAVIFSTFLGKHFYLSKIFSQQAYIETFISDYLLEFDFYLLARHDPYIFIFYLFQKVFWHDHPLENVSLTLPQN